MNKIKAQDKRAFTLTELLIVVIVIGVLSAVTLPKFNRVIENRKVTEAEEMMSAVRTEQERRCSMDQNYTTKFSNLQDIIASNTTKNYTYSLQKQGISAKSNNADYTLKILSYEDGSYCCEGDGCKKLNKNYPACAGLSFPESSCVGTESGDDGLGPDPEGKECTDGEVQGSQTCNGCGTQTTQLCVNGKWTDSLGACSKTEEECKPKPVECPEPKPATTEECEPCGETRSRSVTCGEDGQWIIGEWNAECKKEGECPVKEETCDDLRGKGTLTSYCRDFGMYPKSEYQTYHKDKSQENCCYTCPAGCVEENNKCLISPWMAERTPDYNAIAVRYSPNDTTAYLSSLGSAAGDDAQYGGQYGTGSGENGVCDFGAEMNRTFSVSELNDEYGNMTNETYLAGLCAQKCGSQQECDASFYAKRGDWVAWIKGEVGGDTACKLQHVDDISDLYANNTFFSTRNMKLNWEPLSGYQAEHFDHCPTGVLGCEYAHLHKLTSVSPENELERICKNKSNSSCTSLTGIPSDKMKTNSVTLRFGDATWPLLGKYTHVAGGSLTVTTTHVDVSYLKLDKITCKRRTNAGSICYPEGM